jgi:CHASE3 domain sensor protein
MSDTSTSRPDKRRKVLPLVCLVLAFLLIIANGALALVVLRDMRRANAKVDTAHQTIRTLKEAEVLAEEGGWHQRIYRLSGERRHLDTYREAQSDLSAALEQLRGSFANDQAQSERLALLRTAIDRDDAELAVFLARTPTTGNDSLAHELAAGVHRSSVIHATAGEMLENEQSRLRERLANLRSRNALMQGTVALGTLGSVGLIGTIFALVRRDARQSEALAFCWRSGTASGSSRQTPHSAGCSATRPTKWSARPFRR